ncbi:MAG: phage holin family protein, partial [Roseibium sp.]
MLGSEPFQTEKTLISDLFRQILQLLRGEVRLAKAEVQEKLATAKNGLALIAVALVLALPAIFILMFASVYALISAGLSPALAALSVGATGLLVAGLLTWLGLTKLSLEHLTPTRTLD